MGGWEGMQKSALKHVGILSILMPSLTNHSDFNKAQIVISPTLLNGHIPFYILCKLV